MAHLSDNSVIMSSDEWRDNFLFLSNNRWTHSLLGQLRSYVKRTFIFGYQILLTFALHT